MKTLFFITLLATTISYADNHEKKKTDKPQTVSTEVTSTQAQTNEIKVGVKGMVCAFCAQGIEKSFKKEKAISKVDVSLENKYVKLTFKDGQTLPKDRIAEILKEAGYEAVFEK